jgi:hypothetical protein
MLVAAVVRVRSGSGEQERPDSDRLKRAAYLLGQAGFRVLRIGRFGIGDYRLSPIAWTLAAPGLF